MSIEKLFQDLEDELAALKEKLKDFDDQEHELNEEIEAIELKRKGVTEGRQEVQAECDTLKAKLEFGQTIKTFYEEEKELDKEDEYEAFQKHIVKPLDSGNPNSQIETLKYIQDRGLPTPDAEAEEASTTEIPEALAQAG